MYVRQGRYGTMDTQGASTGGIWAPMSLTHRSPMSRPRKGSKTAESPEESESGNESSGGEGSDLATLSPEWAKMLPILAGMITEQIQARVRMAADDFVERIDGIQNVIPTQVRNGIGGMVSEIQGEISDIARRRIDDTLNVYVTALNRHQKMVGTRIYVTILLMSLISTIGGTGIAWWLMPSYREIVQTRTLLDSMHQDLARTPVEIFYQGKPYVRVRPGSDLMLQGPDGIHAYAEILPRSEKSIGAP